MRDSLEFPGKCHDETCCKGKASESECRCHLSERLHLIARMRSRLPTQDAFTADEVVLAVWRERLRIMAIVVEESANEPVASRAYLLADRIANRACELSEADATRETALTAQDIERARLL